MTAITIPDAYGVLVVSVLFGIIGWTAKQVIELHRAHGVLVETVAQLRETIDHLHRALEASDSKVSVLETAFVAAMNRLLEDRLVSRQDPFPHQNPDGR